MMYYCNKKSNKKQSLKSKSRSNIVRILCNTLRCPGLWPHILSMSLPTGFHLVHHMLPPACGDALCGFIPASHQVWFGVSFPPMCSCLRALGEIKFWTWFLKRWKSFPPSDIILCQNWDLHLRAWVCHLSSPRHLVRRFRSLFPLFDNPTSNLHDKSCPFLNDSCPFRKICENDYWNVYISKGVKK